MRAVFDSERLLQGWLDAEAALARALADVALIPAEQAEEIAAACRAELYDLDVLRSEIAASQHPLVPLVRALAARSGEAGHWAHWGATTQDIIDTGLVLQLREAVRLLASDLARALVAVATLAERHAATPMPGRTHGQHAVPITFGLKAASWGDELVHARSALLGAGAALPASLAGAAGTLASLGAAAQPVLEAYCDRLDLPVPEGPWHVARFLLRDLVPRARRDRRERRADRRRDRPAPGQRDRRAARAGDARARRLVDDAAEAQPDDERVPDRVGAAPARRRLGRARGRRACRRARHGRRGPPSGSPCRRPASSRAASPTSSRGSSRVSRCVPTRCAANLELTRGAIVAEELMMRARPRARARDGAPGGRARSAGGGAQREAPRRDRDRRHPPRAGRPGRLRRLERPRRRAGCACASVRISKPPCDAPAPS